ncbi:putative pentatricopeptide repeat-containing protein At3g13770, mitochondrial [Cryptomeria japonica]|uniref:putative pentatricopeptide repeat-containing protein At3g13770, mitochondrial n=1 Tax=Cryptomeria japonica TaxID=3369 RepID=UPI0025AB8C60|nr:putative pentatricopeptide repeat-containing protein At3g13770, mitochondrial [Cryptomeria japonica]
MAMTMLIDTSGALAVSHFPYHHNFKSQQGRAHIRLPRNKSRSISSRRAKIEGFKGRAEAQVAEKEKDYAWLLRRCITLQALTQGRQLHAHLVKTGWHSDIDLETQILIMYAKCGVLEDAYRAFAEMTEPSVVSCTALIGVCARNGHCEEAIALFIAMQETGIKPNHLSFASVLTACASAKTKALGWGKQLHCCMIKSRGTSLPMADLCVDSSLVDMYAKCGSTIDARQVFDEMIERDVISWTVMISGYVQQGQAEEALEVYNRMLLSNMKPNQSTFTSVLKACARIGSTALQLGKQIHASIVKNAFEGDVFVGSTLVDMYAKSGSLEDARQVFDKMPEQDVVSWNGLISAYGKYGTGIHGCHMFVSMLHSGVSPNESTLVAVLNACARLAALELGKQVHSRLIVSGIQYNVVLGNSLVDMYAKCGSIVDARTIFDEMPELDLVSWNTIIQGYAKHGIGKEALLIFDRMQHAGIRPDYITYLGLLSACSHSGLVDEGWHLFHSMSGEYSITPTAEHYACMVDILGRAGRLDEACNFISKMPFKPGASVWGALLSSCRVHGNIELGELAAKHLFELEPKSSASYVMLSSMYAAQGRWEDVEIVRKTMRDRGVKKEPGCSWIEVEKIVYKFFAGDRSHPQTDKIYATLERLALQMKEAGYFLKTSTMFHDVEKEQKDHLLGHHSEKLAIAFGLISTPSGTPLRIFKNLRVCNDCHTASKFISKIAKRNIILRDTNRFHHFTNGVCSCGDYW